jgi:TolB protein
MSKIQGLFIASLILVSMLSGLYISCSQPAGIKPSLQANNAGAAPEAPGKQVQGSQAIIKPPDPVETIPVVEATDTSQLTRLIGKKVRVIGTIVEFNSVYDNNKKPIIAYFANKYSHVISYSDWRFDQSGTDFKLMIYKENFPQFPDFDTCYNEEISIDGTVESFKNGPVIWLTNTNQINFTHKKSSKINLPDNLKNTKVLFISDRASNAGGLDEDIDGMGEIYIMNADGSNTLQLTNSGGRNRCPALSPDKKRIAYMSNLKTNYYMGWDIFTINVNGTDIVRMTNDHARNYNPQWSPDGTRIVFASDFGCTQKLQIFMMNSDGTNIRQITATPSPSSCYAPCFTPDGKEIVFVSNNEGQYAISKINLETNLMTNLTQENNIYSDWPVVSPDGKKIVYHSYEDKKLDFLNKPYKICSINIDGTDKRVITSNSPDGQVYTDWYPSWSPDGSKIIFSGGKRCMGLWQKYGDGQLYFVDQIYMMNSDGSDLVRIPYIWGNNWFPRWY